MENASEGTHSNKNSLSISSEERAGLTFGLPRHSHWRCSGKKETPIGYYTPINLRLQTCGKTYISGENLRLLNRKCFLYLDQHRLHLLTHFLQCRVSSNFRAHLTDCNFIMLFLLLSRISLNWFLTASGVLLLVSRIIYLNKCNRLDIIIFRL